MPFIRTTVPQATPSSQRQAIVDGIHQALMQAIGMPEDELFNLVQDYAPGSYFFSRTFNGISRSENAMVVEITLRRGRSDAMKRDLYARIARHLQANAQVAPEDIYIFMHENDYSDWSAGHGKFAMNLVQQLGA